MPPVIVFVGADLLALARLEAAARAAGVSVVRRRIEALGAEAGGDPVQAVVVDLDSLGVEDLDRLAGSGAVGFYAHVDEELRAQAQAAGIRAVPRGRFWRDLPELLGLGGI